MLQNLLIAAVVLNGILAGTSLDQSIKQVPSRRRIGIRNYAVYTRGADLGSGLLWYILLPNSAVLVTIGAAVTAWLSDMRDQSSLLALTLAAGLSVAHSLATIGAAPKMLRSRKVPLDDETSLRTLFDRFERWQALRAALQAATFASSLWALVAPGG